MDPYRRVPLFQINNSQQSTSIASQQQRFQCPNENVVVTSVPVVQTIFTNMPVGTQKPSLHSIAPSMSSSTAPNFRKPFGQLNERELNRRIKKQKMERRRRATIADKLTTLHGLVVSLVGDNENQSYQKTEISEKLDQCVNVMKVLTEVVKENPDLKARIQRPSLLSLKPSERNRRHGGGVCDIVSTSREETKENIPPPPLSSANQSSMLSTSTPLMLRGAKRESTDSGLEQSQASTSNLFLSRTSTSNAHEVPSPKRPRESPLPKIWRPYSE